MMKKLKKFFASKTFILSACLFVVICSQFSIEIHTLIWHIRHGNEVTFDNVTIILPKDWILHKKSSKTYSFVHMESGSAFTIGKTGVLTEKLANTSKQYKRIMFIDGKEAFWERFPESGANDIREYILIPSEDILITYEGKIKNISDFRNMLSHIYFSSEQELASTDNSKVNYYSKVVTKHKEKIQHEILNHGSDAGDKIILANEFLDWLRKQKVVDANHIEGIGEGIGDRPRFK